MVRGAGIRVTGLGSNGSIPTPIRYATSKAVAVVRINESVESSSDEALTGEGDDNTRMRLTRAAQPIFYSVDIDFLRVDPGILSLVAGVPQVLNDAGDIVGFDGATRRRAVAFALEVWSRLAGTNCTPEGVRQYGYTLLPFLKGGYLSGFVFSNGLVSFNLRGAKTRKGPRWGVGPYDLEGTHERLTIPVSRNTTYRSTLTTAVPPTQSNGVIETDDVIYGGTATVTTSDVIDGGDADDAGDWIIYGGRAL
jgi:hypothetical protein